MNFIESVSSFIFSHKTIAEKIKNKSDLYFIDKAMKLNKIAFGYFLDRHQVLIMHESREIEALRKHQWFAGSLTAEQFALLLQEFLSSSVSSAMTAPFRQKIESYISMLQNSADQGYLIDLIRSRDLRLVYLILTGSYVGEDIQLDPQEINAITQETFKQLHQMKVGEKRLFLVGSLLHETRLRVEKKETGWQVCYFDSSYSKYKVINYPDPSPLQDAAFWNKLYALKFKNTSTDVEKLLDRHLAGKVVQNHYIMKPQEKNTCHFRSLLGALKKECLQDSKLSPEESLKEWKTFKLVFGEFLLQQQEINPGMKAIASRQQEVRKEKIAQRQRFLDIVQQSQINQNVQDYFQALQIFDSQPEVGSFYSPYQKLKVLDTELRDYLKQNSGQFELFEPQLRALKNPCIESTLNLFKADLQKERSRIEQELEQEMQMVRSGFYRTIEQLQSLLKKEDQASFRQSIFNYKPLKKEKVLTWLDAVEQEPDLLVHLSRRPLFVSLLLHSLLLGEAARVLKLFDMLEEQDKTVMMESLDQIVSHPYLSVQCLPDSLMEFYKSHQHHPLMQGIALMLGKQILKTHSIIDIFNFEKIAPPDMFDSMLYRAEWIRLSYEQILVFFDEISTGKVQIKWDTEAHQRLLFTIMRRIVQLGAFDLLDNASGDLRQKLIDTLYANRVLKNYRLINLTVEQLQRVEAYMSSSNESILKMALRDTLVINQYRHKRFDQLSKHEALMVSGDYLEDFYMFKVSEEDVQHVLAILPKVKSENLFFHILKDLVKNIYTDFGDREVLVKNLVFINNEHPSMLNRWLDSCLYEAYRFEPEISRFLLEAMLTKAKLFNQILIEHVISANLFGIDEEQFQTIEGWLLEAGIKTLQLYKAQRLNLPEEWLKKCRIQITCKPRLTEEVSAKIKAFY